MHRFHKRLTGAANSSIEIIIAWSELLQMRKRLFVRNWIRRLLRYLCIPVGFFLIVVPLYSLMIRQTIQAQSSSAMEMLTIGTTQLERCLSNIRSTTNKLFSETEYTLLASSYDNSILGDYQTLARASKSLQDKTYDSSVITYSYIIHIIGTKGEIKGVFDDSVFTVRTIDTASEKGWNEEVVDLKIGGDKSGMTGSHGGGDLRLVEDFVHVLQGEEPSISCTTIKDSIHGHLGVFCAERARKENAVITMPDIR